MPKRKPVVFSVDWHACIRCGACVAVCPQAAGFTTPFDTIAVDTPCDIACMACERVCPVTAIASRTAILKEVAHPV
jgi:formate hydrogenlyase subunit 6/NADH:ubiquinone oxidoreductase subunit I